MSTNITAVIQMLTPLTLVKDMSCLRTASKAISDTAKLHHVATIGAHMYSTLLQGHGTSVIDDVTGRLIISGADFARRDNHLHRGNDVGPIVGTDDARGIVWVAYIDQGYLKYASPQACTDESVSPTKVSAGVRDVSCLGIVLG